MADAVDTLVVFNGKWKKCYRFIAISDATGESAVIKIDKSTLTNWQGLEPGKLVITKIEWAMQGYTSVRLLWDHTTDDEIAVLNTPYGCFDWTAVGGLVDPASTGGTGDVLLTTAGATTGGTYNITIWVTLGNGINV